MKLNIEKDIRMYITEKFLLLISTYLTVISILSVVLVGLTKSTDGIIMLMLSSILWWGYYVWFKESKWKEYRGFREHIFSLFGLVLTVVCGVTSFVGETVDGVFFFIYPVMISCILKKKSYIYWSIVYFLMFLGCQSYLLYKNNMLSNFTVELLGRVAYCILSIMTGLFVYSILEFIFHKIKLYRIQRQKEKAFQLFNTLIPLVERRYHIEREEIGQMSQMIEKMNSYYPKENIQSWEINLASLVHYVLWMYVPEYLYEKEGDLTVQERQLIRNHVYFGADLLAEFDEFERVKMGILHHREHIDGNGYPLQLKGEEIPLFAQMIGIADEFIMMTNYRRNQDKIYSIDEALGIINALSGTVYDEKLVVHFNLAIKELYNIHTSV